MNRNIQKLHQIACKTTRRIIGLMSGTSLDGLDIAVCQITGSGTATKLTIEQFTTVSYNNDFKEKCSAVFAKRTVDLQLLCILNEWIAEQHSAMINTALESWNIDAAEIDLIASHGQTIFHAPKSFHNLDYPNASLQIGDGDHLAVNTGIITISDFRQKHLAIGGEGAPLAVYGDWLLFKNDLEDTMLLNIGGISNFTFLPADSDNFYSSDIGPGNTMMDSYMREHFDGFFDKDAAVAKSGTVSNELLEALLSHQFLSLPFPKTTGPELFNIEYLNLALVASATENLPAEDVMATLNRFSAKTICEAIKVATDPDRPLNLFVSGGGMHNPMLMEFIAKALPHISIRSTAEKGIDPDAKEAVLFAILANECVAGNAETFGTGSVNLPAVCMGKISLPD